MHTITAALASLLLVTGSLTVLPVATDSGSGSDHALTRRIHLAHREISSDGKWAVYCAAEGADGARALFSVPRAGGSVPVRLGGPLASPAGERWALTADGRRVVFLAGTLQSVAIDGSSAPVRLDGTPDAGSGQNVVVQDFTLGSAGTRVVYRAAPQGRYAGLFSVPADGSAGATELVAPNERGEVERTYALSPDETSVVFLSHHEDGAEARLFSVASEGGTPVCLVARGAPVADFRIDANGARVVYRVAQGASAFELLSTPIDGSQGSQSLSGAPLPGRTLGDFEIAPDSARVVYQTELGDGTSALHAVLANGSAAPLELAHEVASGFVLLRDGRVLYTARRAADEGLALYARALDGASAPVEISAPLAAGASVGWFEASRDGARVVYQIRGASSSRAPATELWAVGLSKKNDAQRLAGLDEARACRLDAGASHIVFLGAHSTLQSLGLDKHAQPVALATGVDEDFRLSPDGARLLGSRSGSSGQDDGRDNVTLLFSVPLDASAPPIQLAALAESGPTLAEGTPGERSLGLGGGSTEGLGNTVGFRDFSYGLTGSPTPTGEKPECKLWWNDGSWWGSLYSDVAQQYHIFRLDLPRQTWVDTGVVLDPRSNSKGDVMWDQASSKLYLASHLFSTSAGPTATNWGRLFRYSYSSTKGYRLDPGFPVDITRGNAEALTFVKDSLGRLWATWVQSSTVMINHTNTSDTDWGVPFVLPVAPATVELTTDDISASVRFGTNVGVMWSNQVTATTYFAVHRDADPDTTWSQEIVLPDINCTGACSDDLFSLKSDAAGNVGAALKTSLTGPDDPLIMLAIRTTDGVWSTTTFGRVQDHHTRPVLLFDERHKLVFVFATHPENGGAIYFKSTPLTDIAFPTGLGKPFIQNGTDITINNATSTKQNLDGETDLLVLASDQNTRMYVHNMLNLPPSITAFFPTEGAVGSGVTITGGNFKNATGVEFNGVPAQFTILSHRQIRATVPDGATTGRIRVLTNFGNDSSDTFFGVGAVSPDGVVEVWPPNHKFVGLDLAKVIGSSSAVVTSVSQDERLEGDDSDRAACCGGGVGTHIAGIRAEHNKDGNGRVYRVTYTDTLTQRNGFIRVVVPTRKGAHALDDGQLVDSCNECGNGK